MISRAAVLLLAFSTLPLTAEVRDLKAFFQERCAVCHGPEGTGRGVTGARLGGRNLADPRWLAKQEEAGLVASILKGRGAMPGFRRQLSEAEGRRLVAEIIRPLAARKRS
ncbi:MAG: cytochrome c [Geothrix sp.]|uniref:c-type cytochrome n=1 Tax=Geothrix sp. TaxID=1962974 RepID=UPI0017D2D4FC|nr:cytochrome c [Geothrix sp.]NWJ42261.1 cytochrome c [Geothrix sp.]WIL19772.1 MAG: cytochrome c [Geothrix sp.]